jgi:hypothetical protein
MRIFVESECPNLVVTQCPMYMCVLLSQLTEERMDGLLCCVVELLDMRKRQVLLAKSGQYIEAEKLKRKADMLEVIEIDVIAYP